MNLECINLYEVLDQRSGENYYYVEHPELLDSGTSSIYLCNDGSLYGVDSSWVVCHHGIEQKVETPIILENVLVALSIVRYTPATTMLTNMRRKDKINKLL